MRSYYGIVDGRVLVRGPHFGESLSPRHDLHNHSPDGFAWGFRGSGPAQLALAILADATGDDQLALRHYQQFKDQVVAQLPQDQPWGPMSVESVREWVQRAHTPAAELADDEG